MVTSRNVALGLKKMARIMTVSNLDFILTDWKIGNFGQARSKLLLPDRFRARVETM